MAPRTPKTKKVEIVFAKEIRTVVVDGSVEGSGPEILTMVPLESTPHVMRGKAIQLMIGNTRLVFTKAAAKGMRETLDRWLKGAKRK